MQEEGLELVVVLFHSSQEGPYSGVRGKACQGAAWGAAGTYVYRNRNNEQAYMEGERGCTVYCDLKHLVLKTGVLFVPE